MFYRLCCVFIENSRTELTEERLINCAQVLASTKLKANIGAYSMKKNIKLESINNCHSSELLYKIDKVSWNDYFLDRNGKHFFGFTF